MARKSYSSQAVLDSTFSRVGDINSVEIELRADFSRYLCVLVSGFLEQSVRTITAKYARERSQPQIADYVIIQTSRLANLNCEKLIKHFASLNRDWTPTLNALLVDETKDAVNSVVALRHSIAHGQAADVTFERIFQYYVQVKRVVTEIERMTS
jgi:hypothetical protein